MVCCSDLNRTRQTWAQISKMQGFRHNEENSKIRYDARLREKGGGVLEGQPLQVFKKESMMAGMDLRLYKPEGGERWQDVMDRAESFLTEITDELLPKKGSTEIKQKQILVVTHGGWIGEFLNVVRKLGGRQAIYNNSAKNTAMYIIKFERNAKSGLKPRIILENDNEHLKLKINPTEDNEEEEKKAVPSETEETKAKEYADIIQSRKVVAPQKAVQQKQAS